MPNFFHQTTHFEYLVRTALPELIRSYGYGIGKKLIVWSAGCFSGEEPYTLAMILSEFARRYPGLGFHFLVLATDISADLLEIAKRGIYDEISIDPVPMELRKKYLLRSKDRAKRLVRIASEVRELVKFRKVDLREEEFRFREPVDIVFCHSGLGRMGKGEREKLLDRMYHQLSPGGYLFLQPAGPADGPDVPWTPVAPMVYRKLEV